MKWRVYDFKWKKYYFEIENVTILPMAMLVEVCFLKKLK
jgi:hypothetical protein